MSWVKMDDGWTEHPKLVTAGPMAALLWAAGLAYCNRQKKRTGVIPAAQVPGLFVGLRGTSTLAGRLVDVGLWEEVEGGFVIHDYHDYQPSTEEQERRSAARSAAGRLGGQRSGETRRSKPEANEQANPKQVASTIEANPKQTHEAKPNPDPDPDPGSEKRSPPAPSEAKPRDPMAATWGAIRDDVLRVHARYREVFGLANHKLRNAADLNATCIAEAIDAHGEAACLLVLKYARADGMVSGKQDDKGLKHEKITYVLGNPDTFARILRNAEQSEGRDANRRPASELLRKACAL